jgi:hypothetical protein
MLELFRFPGPTRTIIGVLLPGYKQVRPALIDTGADRCVLPYEEGKQLNLPPPANHLDLYCLIMKVCQNLFSCFNLITRGHHFNHDNTQL